MTSPVFTSSEYVLRHSLATLARNRGAEKWDLEGFMGHRAGSQTEVYAIGEFPSVVRALESIISEIESLAPSAMHRSRTGPAKSSTMREDKKM
jgi:integrase